MNSHLPSTTVKLSLHHVGIACEDIEKCRKFIRETMPVVRESPCVFDPLQQATVCLLTLANKANLELVSGPVVRNLLQTGVSYYHTCYLVPDIEAAMLGLKQDWQARIISPPKITTLFPGKRAAFLHTPLGLIELLEE